MEIQLLFHANFISIELIYKFIFAQKTIENIQICVNENQQIF